MPKITQPGSGTAGIRTWECDSQAHQTLPCGTPPSVSSLREAPQDPLPAAVAISEQREETQRCCPVGTLRMRGLNHPTFRSMTCAVRSWNSPLADVPVILGLYFWALAALRATSQISVASDRAGLYGEEH